MPWFVFEIASIATLCTPDYDGMEVYDTKVVIV